MSDMKQNTQGLMTITNKHVVYAPLSETAFVPNKRWRLNTIQSIEVCDKNSIKFEIEDENIAFEMEKPNKVAKIVKKQKKKMQEKEKKRASQRDKENMVEVRRRTSIETIVQSVVTHVKPQGKITRRNTSVDRIDKHSFPIDTRAIARIDRRTMALPPEPQESPYCNIRGRQMGRSSTHLEPLSESTRRNQFMRHQSLPPFANKQSYEASLSSPLEENSSYSSGLSSSEDDFTDLKSMEDLINDRKIKLENLKKRAQYESEEIEDGDYVEMSKFSNSSRQSSEEGNCIYDNIPNGGLFANGIGPFESVPILTENSCLYATLDIKETNENSKIHSNDETCIYSQIDFVATKALELAKESLNSF